MLLVIKSLSMKNYQLIIRILTPAFVQCLILWVRYRCFVSPKAEVDSENLVIGRGSRISSFVKLKSKYGPFTIGRNVDIATGCFLSSHTGGLEIGDDVMVGPNSTILSNDYKYSDLSVPISQQGHTSKGCRIGSNVFIGAGTVVLDGSDIGSGSIISANSVISGRIPENSIVSGNPAKLVFTRR